MKTQKKHCMRTVYPKNGFGSISGHRCGRPIWKDGWCKVHHPNSVMARQIESKAKWDKKMAELNKDPLIQAQKRIAELEKQVEQLDRHKCGNTACCLRLDEV